jgi:hypothetical protein
MSGFWFIFVLAIISGFFFGRNPFDVYGVKTSPVFALIDFLGLSHLMKTPEFNATWWYMSLAVVLVLVFPLVFAFTKRFKLIGLFGFAFLYYAGFLGNSEITQYFASAVLGCLLAQRNGFLKTSRRSLSLRHCPRRAYE